MLDMSRGAVMKPEQVKEYATTIKKLGYNMLQLYTEDTYEVTGEPYFGYLRGRYSIEELRDIVKYCSTIDVEVIPCIQTLAHLNQIFNWTHYKKINDTADILLAENERTYELIENMFRSIRAAFDTKYVHIGMDEAHMLGLGKYLDLNGMKNRFDILHNHLERVIEIAKKYDFKPIMWSDMFFRLASKGNYYINDASLITDDVISACPDGVDLVYWDYYGNTKNRYDVMLQAHAKFHGETWYAGGAWAWSGFAPNNEWTLASMAPAMQSCKENEVQNIIMTIWGDNGRECSPLSVLPSLYAIRKFYDGETDMEIIKKEFKEITGESFDDMMLLDIPVYFNEEARDKNKYNDNTYQKFLLYADPFLGFSDPIVTKDKKDDYAALANKLDKVAEGSRYAYLYKSQAALCRALAIKHNLGSRTRAAYKANDKAALLEIIDDFDKAIELTEEFAAAFRRLWFTDNKPHGFDVHELRLGGLLFRMRSQKERLINAVNGTEPIIPELEEELLPCAFAYFSPGDMPCLNVWNQTATVNGI